MEVWKFGGTSVGNPQRMREVADLIITGKNRWIVLSAVSGTTNKLVAFNKAIQENNINRATEIIVEFKLEYEHFIKDLLPENHFYEQGLSILNDFIYLLQIAIKSPFAETTAKLILAQGEIISTNIFHIYCKYLGYNTALIPALDFMQILPDGEPDYEWISKRLSFLMEENKHFDFWITQGYICKNSNGEIDNLQRGGSDYTATILGASIKAEEIIIWTDIDGMHNNDPRYIQNTHPIRKVSFREAAELAYFGAKILHPTCVIPAENAGIPIRLKNTFTPNASGTLISIESSGNLVTAIAAKDHITAIRIRSGRMLNAYGFLRRVFEIFENNHTSIDMITTSEVSVSLTIDDRSRLDKIMTDISPFGDIQAEDDFSIISIVGDNIAKAENLLPRIFESLEGIPIRMVSFGGSTNTISLLVPFADKIISLQKLNQIIFHTNPLTQQKTSIQ
jgi:aspartate kinase